MLRFSTACITIISFYSVVIVVFYVSKYNKIRHSKIFHNNISIIQFLSLKPLKDYINKEEKLPYKKKILLSFNDHKSYMSMIQVLNEKSKRSKTNKFSMNTLGRNLNRHSLRKFSHKIHVNN